MMMAAGNSVKITCGKRRQRIVREGRGGQVGREQGKITQVPAVALQLPFGHILRVLCAMPELDQLSCLQSQFEHPLGGMPQWVGQCATHSEVNGSHRSSS